MNTCTPTSVKEVSSTLVVKTLENTQLPPIQLPQNTPQDTATPEPTVAEKDFPNALLQILVPGNNSQLASPFTVQASVFPGEGNLVTMQLFGEDGRTMTERILKMVKTEYGWVNLEEEIKFEIASAGEASMLVLSTRDEYGRRIAQSTSQIFLMQIGKSEIEENDFFKLPYVVQSPRVNATVKGGLLTVYGYAHPYNSNPIIIELINESGGVRETKIIHLDRLPEGQNYVYFFTEIPYSVEIDTQVRLTIRQRSIMLPNIDVALSSQLITLKP